VTGFPPASARWLPVRINCCQEDLLLKIFVQIPVVSEFRNTVLVFPGNPVKMQPGAQITERDRTNSENSENEK